VGRRAILLELNSKAYYSIGIDLGTLHTTIAITDLLGRIEKKLNILLIVNKVKIGL